MKIALDNYKEIIKDADQNLIEGLLIDIEEINNILENNGQEHKKICIDIQDFHNDYSCERTDPCPDYYGLYKIKFVQKENETIGDPMTINELDNAIFILNNFICN